MKRTMGVEPIEDVFKESFDECGEWTLDNILEWLADYGYLTKCGLILRHKFWKKYIKETKEGDE